MARDQRRLAAIVSADVVGYSLLMGRDESATLAALKSHRRELIDPKIAEYGGRIVKTTGDGLLLDFPSVVDAVRCAVDVQRGMAERNAGAPPEERIDFRIGVNVGDIIIDDDDIFGDGVNVAARLQTLADPGGICVSRVVRDQVLDKLSFAFEDLGAQEIKNITRPVEVYRVMLAALTEMPTDAAPRGMRRASTRKRWLWFAGGTAVFCLVAIAVLALHGWQGSTSTTAKGSQRPAFSVAVLPFVARGGTPADQKFAELLTQGTTNALRRRMHYATIASHPESIETGKTIDKRALGRERNVRYLIEGDVQSEGATVTVSTRLLDTDTLELLWSDQFNVRRSDWVADPGAASWSFTSQPQRALWTAESRRVTREPVESASAMDLVVRGQLVDDGSLKGTLGARNFYDEALRTDPRLTIALSSRAFSSWQLSKLDPRADRTGLAVEMDEYARRAVASDRTDSTAWAARAWSLLMQWRWEAALEATAEVMRIEPQMAASAMHTRAWIFSMMGRADEALVLIDKVIALEPRWGSNPDLRHSQCYALLLIGKFDQAVGPCEQSVAVGDDWWPNMFLTAAYAQKGDMDKSAVAKAELLKRRPGFSIAQFKALGLSTHPVFLQQNDTNFIPGLRKAGISDE